MEQRMKLPVSVNNHFIAVNRNDRDVLTRPLLVRQNLSPGDDPLADLVGFRGALTLNRHAHCRKQVSLVPEQRLVDDRAIGEFESFSLDWLAGNLLPCNGVRNLADAFVSPEKHSDTELDDKVQGGRQLRPDVSRELGIVGLKSWPDDILSSSSEIYELLYICFHLNFISNHRHINLC